MFFLAIEKHRLVEPREFVGILLEHALMHRVKTAESADTAAFRRVTTQQADIIGHHARERVVGMKIEFDRGIRAACAVGVIRARVGHVVNHLAVPFLRDRSPNALAEHPVNLEQGFDRVIIHG